MTDTSIVSQLIGVRGYVQAVTFLLTVYVPTALVAQGTPRRNRFALRYILCVFGLIVFSELYTLTMDLMFRSNVQLTSYIIYFMTLKFFCTFILSGVCIKIIYNVNVWSALFCATAGYCLQHIQSKIGSLIKDYIIKYNIFWIYDTLINLCIAAIFYLLIYFVFLKKSKKNLPYSINNLQVAISACVVGVNIFYNSFGIAYLSTLVMELNSAGLDASAGDKLMIFIHVMSMLVALLALVLDFGVSKNKKLADEKIVLDNILEEGKRQYASEKRSMEMINLKCHDLKHQLAAMKGKIYEEQIDELKDVIEIYDSSVKTGNEALDVVLTQKSLYCSQNGIRLTCLLNGENYGFIPRHELYALFTNVIDNAVEAVEKLPEEKRIISITERSAKGFLTVRAENYYSGEIEFEDGLPASAKNRSEHGFGIKSMKLIAEKYGGGVAVSTENDKFILDIYFLQAS